MRNIFFPHYLSGEPKYITENTPRNGIKQQEYMPYRRNNQPFSIDFHAITQSSAQQNTPFCSIKHGLSACKTWPFAQRKATKRSGSDSQ